MKTNINISNIHGHKFKYLINYTPCELEARNTYLIQTDYKNINLFNSTNNKFYVKQGNSWGEINKDNLIDTNLPQSIKLIQVDICIPQFSVNSFVNGVKLVLSINIWINEFNINLGTLIFDNYDQIALDRPVKYMNNEYYECFRTYIPDPKYILYSPEWEDFRINLCKINNKNTTLSTILNFTLYPIEKDNIDYKYIKLNNYLGGQSAINFSSNSKNDFLNLEIKYNINNPVNIPAIDYNLKFNNLYNNDLIKYLNDIYNLKKEDIEIRYYLTIGNQDEFWGELESNPITDNLTKFSFDKEQIENNLIFNKEINRERIWHEGLKILGTIKIKNIKTNTALEIPSNTLIFDIDKYKYFRPDLIQSESNENDEKLKSLYNIKLEDVNMKVYEINAVNKIENKIVQIEKNNDTKSNIIQPVFFRAYPIHDIIIHPNVTENIGLNLNAYKFRVNQFFLKIGDNVFKEIGRTANNVLFKIKGVTLNALPEGVYYILNEDQELISTGKYIFEK